MELLGTDFMPATFDLSVFEVHQNFDEIAGL
jgi:hypothetical protein